MCMYLTPVILLHQFKLQYTRRTWTMEPSQSEMNILSNGKTHDGMSMPMKTLMEEDQ